MRCRNASMLKKNLNSPVASEGFLSAALEKGGPLVRNQQITQCGRGVQVPLSF
jgi:hypothetical protein